MGNRWSIDFPNDTNIYVQYRIPGSRAILFPLSNTYVGLIRAKQAVIDTATSQAKTLGCLENSAYKIGFRTEIVNIVTVDKDVEYRCVITIGDLVYVIPFRVIAQKGYLVFQRNGETPKGVSFSPSGVYFRVRIYLSGDVNLLLNGFTAKQQTYTTNNFFLTTKCYLRGPTAIKVVVTKIPALLSLPGPRIAAYTGVGPIDGTDVNMLVARVTTHRGYNEYIRYPKFTAVAAPKTCSTLVGKSLILSYDLTILMEYACVRYFLWYLVTGKWCSRIVLMRYTKTFFRKLSESEYSSWTGYFLQDKFKGYETYFLY